MAIEITVPSDLWEEDQEAVITSWLVNDGSAVSEGALIAEIMAAKVQYEIHAPVNGIVRIIAEQDAVVAKGALIGRIE